MSLVEGRLWSKLLMLPRPTVSDARHYRPVSKLRSQASLHGVNHNMPFPTALKSLFSTFSVLSTKACPYVWVKLLLLCECWWGILTAGNRVAWGGFEGVLIVWGGEWGKWGGFRVIIRVKCGLQIAVRRVCRSYQQIVNNLWKMV